jgi:L-ribulokinase
MFGAVAAGVFDGIVAAIEAMRPSYERTYAPDPAAQGIYDQVYAIYRSLYDSLGSSQSQLMHGLKRIRTTAARSDA